MTQIVLTYHDIYRESTAESGFQRESMEQYKLPVAEFEKHVRFVSEYCAKNPNVKIRLTFDDGGVSFLTTAAPVLEKYGLRGTFFVSAKYVGSPGFLTNEQLRELAERGHEIGSHAYSHRALTELSEDEVFAEWAESFRILRPFAGETTTASVPEGRTNKTVVRKARDVGATVLHTSVPTTKIAKFGDMEIVGRYAVYRDTNVDDLRALIVDGKKRAFVYAKYLALRVVKAACGKRYDALKALWLRRKKEGRTR